MHPSTWMLFFVQVDDFFYHQRLHALGKRERGEKKKRISVRVSERNKKKGVRREQKPIFFFLFAGKNQQQQ